MLRMTNIVVGMTMLIASLAYAGSGPAVVINTPQDLENINQNLAGNYILGQDIDLRNFNFTPIGSMDQVFTGNFNGNGHRILNLNLNMPKAYDVGLFANVGQNGVIANLTVQDANVTGWNTTGIVAAMNSGEIVSVAVNGNVSGYNNTGALVGANDGKIFYSHAEASVSPQNDFAGVLVGGNTGLIQNSYAVGSVIAPDHNHVGGLTGDNGEGGVINNSYAIGTVAGADNVGGLSGGNYAGSLDNDFAQVSVNASGQFVGGLSGDNISGAVINHCYSTGDVVGADNPEYVGGLVGYNESTVAHSYWDIDTSGQSYSAGGSGETDAAMQNQATYQDWDFKTIWQMETYPVLQGTSPR